MSFSRFLDLVLIITLVVLFGFLMTSPSFIFWGLKPNLILALMVSVILGGAFWWEILLFATVSVAAVSWVPSWSEEFLVFFLLSALIYLARSFLNGSKGMAFFYALFATVLWYLLVNAGFVIAYPQLVAIESIINSVLALVFLIAGRALFLFDEYV